MLYYPADRGQRPSHHDEVMSQSRASLAGWAMTIFMPAPAALAACLPAQESAAGLGRRCARSADPAFGMICWASLGRHL
jgi:hypothetical protein